MWKVTYQISRLPKFPWHKRTDIVNVPSPQDAEMWVREFYETCCIKDVKITPFDPTPDFERKLTQETMEEARRLQRQGPRSAYTYGDGECDHEWMCDYESMFDPSQNKYSCRHCDMKKEDYEKANANRSTSNASGGIGHSKAGVPSHRKSSP